MFPPGFCERASRELTSEAGYHQLRANDLALGPDSGIFGGFREVMKTVMRAKLGLRRYVHFIYIPLSSLFAGSSRKER